MPGPGLQEPVQAAGKLPRDVWMLGFVSMFMDISSEMIHSLLPVFVVSVLGVSTSALGLLEGVAEGTVNLVRIFSGAASDWLGRRKRLAVIGYGIAALTKPLFALAGSFGLVVTARLMDRAGKGIREAPRDALIADLTPPQQRGASYGLRQSLDTIGAIAGPLAAIGLMVMFRGEFRRVFWIAFAPALISVSLLSTSVHEVRRVAGEGPHFRLADLRRFPRSFWAVAAVGAVFTLARFSDAFLLIRAKSLGLHNDYVPVVLIVMNVVYAASAWPAGRLSDRLNRHVMLAVSGVILIGADLVLALAAGTAGLMLGVALWGLHMGLSQGIFAALVADSAPSDRRGVAFGTFSLVTGIALVTASFLAGELWDHFGPPATFFAGAGFAALAVIGAMTPATGRARRVSGF